MPPIASPVATHIVIDDRGRSWIEGTNTKVVEVIADHLAWGWSPEEIHRNHPQLPLSKVFAAFSYYYDHRQDLDAEIERLNQETLAMRAAAGDSEFAARMRAAGKLR
ncbi:MAG TPA: DUF433 domain-containing protein [Tepidisphaeraceae bacterium]|nr:DUF433 domain-containing protein [Tepidisphaeraceae bacterium]